MGKPMCKNLIKAGHDLIVTTHNPDTLKEMEALGAKAVHNGKEVAEEAEVIITMLPNSPQVREVALGKGGIIEGGRRGIVLIDMSSIDPTEIVAVNIAAVSEALTLATKAGTDPELVYQAIRGGLAGSTVLDAKAPMMMDRNFKPGFRIELHMKDLNNALNAGHAVNAALPLTAELMEIMQSLKADGCEKEDHSSIVKYYEKISNVFVERERK